MAFIRKKKTASGNVFQVVESRREKGKVRQRVLVSLSHEPSIGERIAVVAGYVADPRTPVDWRPRWRGLLAKLKMVQEQTGLP